MKKSIRKVKGKKIIKEVKNHLEAEIEKYFKQEGKVSKIALLKADFSPKKKDEMRIILNLQLNF